MTTCYTWQDVEAVFQHNYPDEWAPFWTDVVTYNDEILIKIEQPFTVSMEEESNQFLKNLFKGSYQNNNIILHFNEKTLPINYEIVEEGGKSPRYLPLFKQLKQANIDRQPLKGKPVIAFHSYKGGVGRTLSLLSFVRAVKQVKGLNKLLIIDGDTEAPGLSWLMKDDYPMDFSWYDALALVHEEESWKDEVVGFVANKVRQVPIKIPINNEFAEHYFLPAYREDYQLLSPPVTPEQVVRGKGREWIIADFLSELGERLGVDAVVVDLRAGISEYSAPLLLDPAVQNILVTSTSLQSVKGTKKILKFIESKKSKQYAPIIAVTMVPEEIMMSEKERLSSIFGAFYPEEDFSSIRFIRFAQELVHLDNISSIDKKLTGTSMEKEWNLLAEEYFSNTKKWEFSYGERTAFLSKLYDLADKMEFAEHSKTNSFMRTSSLQQLMSKYKQEIPRAIIMGTKGSGKTFNFLQLVQSKTWESFTDSGLDQDTIIFPIMYSTALKNEALARIDSQLIEVNKLFNVEISRRKDLHKLVDDIKEYAAEDNHTEVQWKHFWEKKILGLIGYDTLEKLNDFLNKSKKRILFIIDGLENVFQDIVEDDRSAVQAIRALCEGVMNDWRSYPKTETGLLVFIRTDIAQKAIKQNFGQFRSLYKPFELKWTHTETLRLVLWMAQKCDQNQIFPNKIVVENLGRKLIEEYLYPFWGRKLGNENSREAKTANWVLYVLSDFKGKLQARDIVRFLKYAAQHSQEQKLLNDRMLTPQGIRHAVKSCSEGKIDELRTEIAVLSRIFDKMLNINSKYRQIPFDIEDLGLEPNEIDFLADNGYLAHDEEGYYLPEIISNGLNFSPSKKGRRKVLQFTRKFEES